MNSDGQEVFMIGLFFQITLSRITISRIKHAPIERKFIKTYKLVRVYIFGKALDELFI